MKKRRFIELITDVQLQICIDNFTEVEIWMDGGQVALGNLSGFNSISVSIFEERYLRSNIRIITRSNYLIKRI